MLCPKCNKSIEESSSECPFCGIIISKFRQAETSDSSIRTFKTKGLSADRLKQEASVNIPYFKIGAVVLGLILLWVIFKPKYVAELNVVSFKDNKQVTLSCNTKEKCVIVYLAPW